ncbi:hypothetical protein D3C74_407880 [compost metagenome]
MNKVILSDLYTFHQVMNNVMDILVLSQLRKKILDEIVMRNVILFCFFRLRLFNTDWILVDIM